MALLEAIWAQSGPILESVLEAKSIKKFNHFSMSFFDRLFNGFGMDFDPLFEGFLASKVDLERDCQILEKPCFSLGFCLFLKVQDFQIRCKIQQ